MRYRRVFSTLMFTVFFSSIIFILPASAEQTKTLNPIADAYVEDVNPSTNYGGQSYLKVSDSGNMFVGESLAFLKFDLSEIPSGATINSAKLQLYTSVYVTSTHNIGAYYCSDNTWTEIGITYDNHPSFTTTATSTAAVASTSKWYEWTVTSDTQTALGTADKKLTIVLKSDFHDGSDWVWFESRDQQYSWMEEYIPKLEISYTSPDTTPPTISNIKAQPGQPTPDNEVTVTASIVDDGSGVKEADLHYSTDEGTNWNNVSMSFAGDSTYTANIPRQEDGTTVQYYVEAFDNSLNKATSSANFYTVKTLSVPLVGTETVAVIIFLVIIVGVIAGAVYFIRLRKREVPSPPAPEE